MAVVEVNQIRAQGGLEKDGHRRYTQIYEVLVDDRTDGPATARLAAGIPVPGNNYVWGGEVDTGALVSTKMAQLKSTEPGAELIYRVTVTFSSKGEEQRRPEDETNESPLDEPIIWSGGWSQHEIFVEKDRNGLAFVNSAGDPFEPQPKPDQQGLLMAQRNEAALNLPLWDGIVGTVNNLAQWGVPARRLLCEGITWQQIYRSNTSYYQINYNFRIGRDLPNLERKGWDFRLLDQGYQAFDPFVGNEKRRILTLNNGGLGFGEVGTDGIPIPTPANLSGGGFINPVPGGQVFLPDAPAYFETLEESDFTTLGLPAVIGAPA